MTSRYTLVPSKITDGGRSIFAYAALEKKVFNITASTTKYLLIIMTTDLTSIYFFFFLISLYDGNDQFIVWYFCGHGSTK